MTERSYPLDYPETTNTNVEPIISLLNYYAQFAPETKFLAGRDVDTYVCTLLVNRIVNPELTEDDDWTSQTISDALEMPGDYELHALIRYITDAAVLAFDDPTESSHAAHVRDALRNNLDTILKGGN